MEILYKIAAVVIAFFVVVFASKKWGEATAKQKQAESNADKMEKYEKIDSKPDIDNPLGGMHS